MGHSHDGVFHPCALVSPDEILLLLPLEVGGQGVIAQCFCAGVNELVNLP